MPENPPDSLDAHLAGLPHGPGFRFIDALVSLEPGRRAVAVYRPAGDEPFFAGHFPGHPIVPGVLMVEAVAQLAGIVAQSDPAVPPLSDLRLAAIRQAKILGAAAPGESLRIEAEITGRLGALVQAAGSIAIGGRVVLQAQVTLSGSPPSGGAADAPP